MEEDIKVLEDLEKRIRNDMFFEYSPNVYSNAITNLIKGYKDLEDKNRTRIIGKYGDVTLDELLKDKYIPKSKVIELIKQLEIIQEEEPDAYLVILYLQKLLEGDDK